MLSSFGKVKNIGNIITIGINIPKNNVLNKYTGVFITCFISLFAIETGILFIFTVFSKDLILLFFLNSFSFFSPFSKNLFLIILNKKYIANIIINENNKYIKPSIES